MASRKARPQAQQGISPAWWIVYGVLCGLAGAGLVVFFTAAPRGTAIVLEPQSSGQMLMVPATAATRTPASTVAPQIININTASVLQLEALPNIGPATAQAIVSYREHIGQFDELEQLLNVSGIGAKTFEGLRGLIVLEDE
ncbi:MAG TPA: helix-hairpin-helix domain-containing protein [Anaerolineales bacterium]|nr:helix-hairpin-helix domain-containing protein [Anaerolineales bacterium]HRQ91805.1 helix-hairpin-helix domain-containing protein [Anaerolineales bacterium]